MEVSSVICIVLCLSSSFISVNGWKDCKFPAIINFGDSNSDTGGLAATFEGPVWPYGESYFGMPEGRYSDGRVILDFIANNLSLPFLSPYLDSLGTNFSHGVNFAVAASTITPPISIIPNGGFSPFYFDVQYYQFTEFKNRSQIIRNRGGIFKDLMPKKEYFPKALYTIDIGANDLGEGFFNNQSIQEVNASVPDIIDGFTTNVKNIYGTGARSFWIHNTGPIGCLPYILGVLPIIEYDSAGCAKPYNEVAQYFNRKLKEAVVKLRKELPLAAFTLVDIYSIKFQLISNPAKYGFELPLVACCAYGNNKYNYGIAGCGSTVTINGTQVFVGSCKRPSVRVNWDGVHSTDAFANYIFDQIATGKFSDPPITLREACHRN